MPGHRDDGYYSIDTGSMPWLPSKHPGTSYKTLRFDRDSGAGTILLRMDPGASYPAHRHTGGEEVYVLSGDLRMGKEVHRAGAFVYSPPGSVHSPRTEEGCVLLVTFPERVEDL